MATIPQDLQDMLDRAEADYADALQADLTHTQSVQQLAVAQDAETHLANAATGAHAKSSGSANAALDALKAHFGLVTVVNPPAPVPPAA